MRRRRAATVALGMLVALVMPLGVSADVIESYDEETVRYADEYACAAVSDDDSYVDTCGVLSDGDGDGMVDDAYIGVYRQECTEDGHFTRCQYESGWAEVGQDAVSIDRDAGTAVIDGAIDDCQVTVTFVVTGGGNDGSFGYVGGPGVRLRDLSVIIQRSWEYSYDYVPADADGTVCDWHTGAFDHAQIGRSQASEVERGFRIHPDEAPLVGGAIEHDRRHTHDSVDEDLFARWADETAEGFHRVYTYGYQTDEDADGEMDTSAYFVDDYSCDATGCEGSFTSGSPATLTLDFAAGSGRLQADASTGCAIDVTVEGTDGGDQSFSSGSDAIGVDEDGALILGRSQDTERTYIEGEPLAGAVVCEFSDLDGAAHIYGAFGHADRSHYEHYLRLDPEGLET